MWLSPTLVIYECWWMISGDVWCSFTPLLVRVPSTPSHVVHPLFGTKQKSSLCSSSTIRNSPFSSWGPINKILWNNTKSSVLKDICKSFTLLLLNGNLCNSCKFYWYGQSCYSFHLSKCLVIVSEFCVENKIDTGKGTIDVFVAANWQAAKRSLHFHLYQMASCILYLSANNEKRMFSWHATTVLHEMLHVT